jgi:hypothetical protein
LIREKRKLKNRHRFHKSARRLKNQSHQFGVMRKKENIPHQPADRICPLNGNDAILCCLLQKI